MSIREVKRVRDAPASCPSCPQGRSSHRAHLWLRASLEPACGCVASQSLCLRSSYLPIWPQTLTGPCLKPFPLSLEPSTYPPPTSTHQLLCIHPPSPTRHLLPPSIPDAGSVPSTCPAPVTCAPPHLAWTMPLVQHTRLSPPRSPYPHLPGNVPRTVARATYLVMGHFPQCPASLSYPVS